MKRIIAAVALLGLLGSGSAMAGGFDHHHPHKTQPVTKVVVVKAPVRAAHKVVKVVKAPAKPSYKIIKVVKPAPKFVKAHKKPFKVVKIIKVVKPSHYRVMHSRHANKHVAWR
jgi:hypothetical protein